MKTVGETATRNSGTSVRQLMEEIKGHIITTKMVATKEVPNFDDREALDIVYDEAYDAKEKMKKVLDILGPNSASPILDELWRLDDERASESLAAYHRIRRLKLGLPLIEWHPPTLSDEVFVYGNCDVLGNRFVYNITIKNTGDTVITNVTTTIVAYPNDCMRMTTDQVRVVPRIEVGGFRTSKFIFLPSKDCVEGRIVCVVSYIDHRDKLHTVQVEPYIIRSVCDLLRPFEKTGDEFEQSFRSLIGSSREIKLEWNADVLLDKAETLLPALNFYLVDVERHVVGEQIVGTIKGFALGKYTSRRVGVIIHITGKKDESHSIAKVEVSGDDEAMLPTTIEEIVDKIDSWICMNCGARLNPDQIMSIEAGSVLSCRYCGYSLSYDLYSRASHRPRPGGHTEEQQSEDRDEMQPSLETLDMSSVPQEHHDADPKVVQGIEVLRGCEIVGGYFEYKVKVVNNSSFVITNVAITIVGFPKDCMKIKGDALRIIKRIEVGGFRSPQFSFIPTKDCVEGNIVASLSLIDYQDNVHTLHVEPFVIRSVCDMLRPLESIPMELDKVLIDLSCTDNEQEVDWNPQILFKKTEKLLPARNFYVVDTEEQVLGEQYIGKIRGFAEGKYTGKKLVLVIVITGEVHGTKSHVKVDVLGEDVSMLPVTTDEISDEIAAWSCLRCGGPLSADEVLKLKARVPVKCRRCDGTLTLDLYRG